MDGTNNQTAAYMYNEAGQLKKVYVSDGARGYMTYYDYNAAGMIEHIRQEETDGTILQNDSYTYDENGNQKLVTHMDGSKDSYDYDLSDQLTYEKHTNALGTVLSEVTYHYDVLGNRDYIVKGATTVNYAHDKANQMTVIDGTNLSYDANGNLTFDGSKTFGYNAEDQLASVKNSAGTTIALYEYNYGGQRTKKVSGGQTERYYYNAGDLAYITDDTNKVQYSFTRDAYGRLLTLTDYTGSAPVNYFYVLNAHGDVIGLRDKNGVQVVTYSYDAFGNPVSSSGTATTGDGKLLKTENPFRYASYFYDDETGMYYLNSRYYKPDIGR
uniref:RHS repeat domain-containing protein n=1 Tax=Aneurinibacillus tyrosinisolvens TaxID=1443435 RepID=UPI000A741237